MKFKHVFIAVFVGTALIAAALIVNEARPPVETEQPTEAAVKATGKCASCHRQETSAIVHQFEMSAHARKGVTCLDCHGPAEGQEKMDHRGFTLAKHPTAKNCAGCHSTEYQQYLRSRHAAPAWAAVRGTKDFTEEQLAHAQKFHPEAVNRPANKLAELEGEGAITKGCGTCHAVGAPNDDGSIGSCTHCHSRHNASIKLARLPTTCGQCHMGPDHSQIEIFQESKHGAIFEAEKDTMNLDAPPKRLTTEDMPVPTCSTCHMSGLEGLAVTHDTTERLSWYLFAEISKKRPAYARGQNEMKAVCLKCHTTDRVNEYYDQAETVVAATNDKIAHVAGVMKGLRDDKLLSPTPFDEPIEFAYFDFWHYFGRTAKHGAFMGGADFVQWHGNYELLKDTIEIENMAKEIREQAAQAGEGGDGHGDEPGSTDGGAKGGRDE